MNCVVDFFGPANLAAQPSRIDHGAAGSPEGRLVGGAIADREEVAKQASPVTHVSKGDAPMLIAHGSKDPIVPHAQSVELAEALKRAEVPATFITMTDEEHGFRSEELDRRVTRFLANHLLGKSEPVSAEAIPTGATR